VNMKLTQEDLDSGCWKKLEGMAREKVAFLRQQNDHPADEAQTAYLRGRIAEVKWLISLGGTDE